MRIALYQPDIPQNTGTILRLAACMNVAVDLIEPAGFDCSDRSLRRAGLDYLDHVALTRHRSWSAFRESFSSEHSDARLILLTTKAQTSYVNFAFQNNDTLLLGRESAGVPQDVADAAHHAVRIEMLDNLRSLNVAVSAAMVLGEALRQTNAFPQG